MKISFCKQTIYEDMKRLAEYALTFSIHSGRICIVSQDNDYQHTFISEKILVHFDNPEYFKDFVYFTWESDDGKIMLFIKKDEMKKVKVKLFNSYYKFTLRGIQDYLIPEKAKTNLNDILPEILAKSKATKERKRAKLQGSRMNYCIYRTSLRGIHIKDSSFSTKDSKTISFSYNEPEILLKKVADSFTDENYIEIKNDNTLIIHKEYLLCETKLEKDKTLEVYSISTLRDRHIMTLFKEDIEYLKEIFKDNEMFLGWRLYAEM